MSREERNVEIDCVVINYSMFKYIEIDKRESMPQASVCFSKVINTTEVGREISSISTENLKSESRPPLPNVRSTSIFVCHWLKKLRIMFSERTLRKISSFYTLEEYCFLRSREKEYDSIHVAHGCTCVVSLNCHPNRHFSKKRKLAKSYSQKYLYAIFLQQTMSYTGKWSK